MSKPLAAAEPPDRVRPRWTDAVMFAALTWFFASPILLRTGHAMKAASLTLAAFPYGYFLLALVILVLRSIFPRVDISFGLPGARWAAMIGILAAAMLFGVSVSTSFWVPPSATLGVPISPHGILNLFMSACFLYVLVTLFLGRPLGPKRSLRP